MTDIDYSDRPMADVKLVEWLEAAIDELERTALAASYWPDDSECPAPRFETAKHSRWVRRFVDEREMVQGVITQDEGRPHSVAIVHAVGETQMPVYLSRHIALNDPQAALDRCDADRKILARYTRLAARESKTFAMCVKLDALEEVLRDLAAGYGYEEKP